MTGTSVQSASPDPAKPDDAVEVGRVVGAWGVKGGLKVKPFAADPKALFSSKRWYVEPPEAPLPRPDAVWPRLLRVVQARESGDSIVATVQDIDDRDAAQALKGARLFVSRASFPTPAADEFYWVDLIGMAVVAREDRVLGTVHGLIETGPHCVLRVLGDSPDAEETLIPFVDAYVDKVDLAQRRITVDWHPDY